MSAEQKQQLDVLINAAGVQLSYAATALDKAQTANAGKQPVHSLIVAATVEFARCNARNVAIQQFSDTLDDAPPELPPVTPPGPGTWPNPPGVPFLLNTTQKAALFAAETGVGPMSAWIALMPGVDDNTLNNYKQFYGPGSAGWGEVQHWYANR